MRQRSSRTARVAASSASSAGTPIDHHQPMHVELQLHQQLVAEGLHQDSWRPKRRAHGGSRSARAPTIGERPRSRLVVKARQLVFDRAQRLDASARSETTSVRFCASANVSMPRSQPEPRSRTRRRSGGVPGPSLRPPARTATSLTSSPTKGSNSREVCFEAVGQLARGLVIGAPCRTRCRAGRAPRSGPRGRLRAPAGRNSAPAAPARPPSRPSSAARSRARVWAIGMRRPTP